MVTSIWNWWCLSASSGNIGIGTSVPSTTLDVNGSISATSITATTGTITGNLSVGGVLTYEDTTNIDSVGVITARAGVNISGGNLQVGGTTVINSGRALYNLEEIKLADTKELVLGSGNDLKIHHSGSHSFISQEGVGALKIKGDDIRFEDAGGTEALRLTSGRLGLGANNNSSYDAIGQNFLIANESSHAGMTIRSGGSGAFGAIHFADGVSDNSEKRAGRILYGHTGDFMSFHTANTERLRITSAGQVNINAASESFGGKVLIKNNVDYTTTDFDDDPTLYLLNGDQTTGVSEAAIILAGRNTSGSTYRAAISGNGSSGIKFHPSSNAEQDHIAAMTIAGTHRIGINVTSPEDPLHVKNNSNAATSIRIQTGTSSTNNGDEYSSVIFDGNGYVGAKIASHRDDGTWNDRGDLRFYSGYGNNVFTQRMRITNTGGVTIGSGNNNSNMSEFGSNTGGLTIDDVGGTNTGIRLSHGNDDSYLVQSSNGNFYISQYGTGSMRFGVGSSGQERLRITSGGEFFLEPILPILGQVEYIWVM